jgi:hypothetical protein
VLTPVAAFEEWGYEDYEQASEMYDDGWGPNYYNVFNTLGLNPKMKKDGGPNFAVGYQHEKFTTHDGILYPVGLSEQTKTNPR